jgi:uncharacterized membrane protein
MGVLIPVAIATLILFLCSAVRHLLFQSTAFDLGYFDQAAYLISVGQPPIVSFWGFHFLGGHGDWILYGIALLYRVLPSVYWLLAIQAIALAGGAIPVWQLALQSHLPLAQARAVALAYLLYPLIFNLNLFDFHPEVMALPLLLRAIWLARQHRIGEFSLCLGLVLGCRDALSLTVAALGLWLLLWERQRICGAIALGMGSVWFVLVTQWLIPQFRPGGVESVWRFAYLGNSVGEIALNLVLKPQLVLSALFTGGNLGYLLLLLLPLGWGLSWRHLAPLVGAVPTLAMNLLSTVEAQKDLLHQYSLPALPFLLVAAIAALAHRHSLVQTPKWIVLWAVVGFVALAKVGYFSDRYLASLDTWAATRSALAQIQTRGNLLTTAFLAPHLTHRPMVKLAIPENQAIDLTQFDYALLDSRHPGWNSSPELLQHFITRLQHTPQLRQQSQQDGVYLFVRSP